MNDVREQRLQSVLHAYFQAIDRGEKPDHGAILEAHPDLREELGQYFDDASKLDRIAKSLKTATFDVGAPPASAAEAPTPEQLRDKFPQFEILELLGQGGMGAVYKARQKGLDRLVALKILPGNLAQDPMFAERFLREAKALARLNHPHIVAVYDVGRTVDGLCYFVMEFVDGVNLRQAMRAGEMSPKEALAIVPQICEALQYAHDEGVVHRDIKPENVLLDRKGRVKIADFGLAKLLGAKEHEASLTGTHQVMGTIRYMAPEQMEGSKQIDHRADIYSLGVVFYELLTGELPVGRFDLPSTKVHIDVRLDEVVIRALAKEPDKRWQQASEVKTAIELATSGPRSARPQPASASARSLEDVLPQVVVIIVAGVMGGLTVAAGVSLTTFALLSESPGKREFWGWMGGALACHLGGGGALIGAINSLRQLAGAGELTAFSGWKWIDRMTVAYGVCGGAVLVAAVAQGSPVTPARWSIGLFGTILLGQAILFRLLRDVRLKKSSHSMND
jgi:predicted Ser/Thr protein kinase